MGRGEEGAGEGSGTGRTELGLSRHSELNQILRVHLGVLKDHVLVVLLVSIVCYASLSKDGIARSVGGLDVVWSHQFLGIAPDHARKPHEDSAQQEHMRPTRRPVCVLS